MALLQTNCHCMLLAGHNYFNCLYWLLSLFLAISLNKNNPTVSVAMSTSAAIILISLYSYLLKS